MPAFTGTTRNRVVSGASVLKTEDEEIARLTDDIGELRLDGWSNLRKHLAETDCLQRLRFALKDDSMRREHNPQDSFRRAHGFQVILTALEALAGSWSDAQKEKQTKYAIHFLAQLLSIIEAALSHHKGNNRYFRQKIDDGGWTRLQNVSNQIFERLLCEDSKSCLIESYCGTLFATALGTEAVSDIYMTAEAKNRTQTSFEMSQQVVEQLQKDLQAAERFSVPDLLKILVSTWADTTVVTGKEGLTSYMDIALPASIQVMLRKSTLNVVDCHLAGVLGAIQPILDHGNRSAECRDLIRQVALELHAEGVWDLDEVAAMLLNANKSGSAAKFLLDAMRASRRQPSIQFDLAQHGSSSIELTNLRRPFPASHTSGYTLSLWAKFEHFDHEAHTTLFGAFDKTQTCFILAYLEKDTKHLILQTSIRGSKPSVRFKSTVFCANQWYHICIAHRKPKGISSSRASLFVNGEFVEQIKATFPTGAPVDPASNTVKVQAFLGTPADLSPTSSSTICSTRWSLASAVLLQDVLTDDMIAVLNHLGPAYYGNFQDCLGSFQTYSASAALNLRNESFNLGKEESSDLILAVRQKAGHIIPEESILLNISPAAVLDDDDRNNIDESQLIRSLSKTAAKNLSAYTRSGANAVAINGAVPAINDALVQTNGVAVLLGEPLVTVPQCLDDALWRLGGCAPIGLNLINRAGTTEDVLTAVKILLESVKNSWRNSEVMERHGGYGILGNLLREKLGAMSDTSRTIRAATATPALDRATLGLRVFEVVLEFVGFDTDDEGASIIVNPLAYKILIIDTSLWRCHSFETQELFFKQLTAFAVRSRHHKFNIRRLNRMRALRRLLEALKVEPVHRRIMPFYAATFKALLPTVMSAEMLRSVALFITYSIHKRSVANRSRRQLPSEMRSRGSSGASSNAMQNESESSHLTQFQIGVEILRVYSDILCTKGDTTMVKKFAKTVTNKWLLYLLSESQPEVVVLSMRVLARLLVLHGELYVRKFKEKTGGFTIMCHRLKRWWHLPALWPACFAILFGMDVAELDLDRSFDLFGFVDMFHSTTKDRRVVVPEILEVIVAMLQSGLRSIASHTATTDDDQKSVAADSSQLEPPQRLSMSTMAPPNPYLTLVTPQHVNTFGTVLRFLADLQSRSDNFRHFAALSSYVQGLLSVLYPVIVGSDIVEATVELTARDSVLSLDGTDAVTSPLLPTSAESQPVDRKDVQELSDGRASRRGSSFVFITQDISESSLVDSSITKKSVPGLLFGYTSELKNENNALVQDLLEILISIFVDQILMRKDFPGLGLFLRTPPGFIEHQHYFESWIIRNTISELSNCINLNQRVLTDPKALTNLARFFTHLGEALFEGWFVGGAEAVLDLAGSVLEYLQRNDVSQLKSVRLCAQPIATMRSIIFRVVLLSLSHVHDRTSQSFLAKLSYWQTVLLSSADPQPNYLQYICFLLYRSLISSDGEVRAAAADLWRIILVQKPSEAALILGQPNAEEQKDLIKRFEKLVEIDNETFLVWVEEHKQALNDVFFGTLSRAWDAFVSEENKKTADSARSRITRRRERLKLLAREEIEREELIRRHEISFDHWTTNIYISENLKHQRLMQDQQDDRAFSDAIFRNMLRNLQRSSPQLVGDFTYSWQLDQTEGRNRMRIRLIKDMEPNQDGFSPKRKGSEIPSLKLDTKALRRITIGSNPPTPVINRAEPSSSHPNIPTEPFPKLTETNGSDEQVEVDEEFEIIDDPNAGVEEFEDKNRKVMRSLHRGDQVKHVTNVSRIVGLEAVEGLLILGKDYIYLIDDFFQRADGEIVHVWQAPQEERDDYVRMISGRDVSTTRVTTRNDDSQSRSWKWSEVISVSKRRFLFRDVAIEMFFGDGQSFLLTTRLPTIRNDLCNRIISKAPQYGSADLVQSEFAWRYETLKSAEEEPQTFGARFANVFSQSTHLAATKRWQRGELSNFHYLMIINTMAGRTYNDLTQYPVFPWVLADYTSEDLDLSDPKSYRDLSKPMGCQTASREADFRDRYKTFAEMGDHNAPAFHYGTHYSSAMIVTSYLIRLKPFVKSYLLLQGGSFDHPDRMFFSIEQSWRSASRVNMTDVRELTPEFFYLSEFLTNPNGYDFGLRQGSKKSIANVELPPWAKGDPRIFIAKQRQALESPYVSRHLHKWIDLIFGCKQKGEAAVEAVNVFHHLSYQGAKDLDAIDDPMERLATIGIIHNFGQTPYQIFTKMHPARGSTQHNYKRVDTAVESLTRLPSTLLDGEEKVASLTFAWKSDRLLCSGAFRLNIPPQYDKYMEWGFFDGSIRFYAAESRKQIGLFEHLHIGQLSGALFVDSRTLVTSGTDCTVAVWTVHNNGKTIDLQPRATLFGHHHPVTTLAVSRSFNALLSVSTSGEVILWDLNRCELVRRVDMGTPLAVEAATINDVTGNVVLCHGPTVDIYTLNGDLLLSHDTSDRQPSDGVILSVACYEGAGNEWLERDILFTGHKKGTVKVWNVIVNPRAGQPQEPSFALELIRQLNHADPAREDGGNVGAGISCILPMPQMVYTGDEDGRVCEWNCVQRH